MSRTIDSLFTAAHARGGVVPALMSLIGPDRRSRNVCSHAGLGVKQTCAPKGRFAFITRAMAHRRIMRTRPSRAPLLGASGKTHCVCFEVQTGKHLLDLNFTAFVPGCVQRRHSASWVTLPPRAHLQRLPTAAGPWMSACACCKFRYLS